MSFFVGILSASMGMHGRIYLLYCGEYDNIYVGKGASFLCKEFDGG